MIHRSFLGYCLCASSVAEVTLLLQAAPGPKYKAAFATAGACPGAGRGRRAARLRGRRTQGRRCRLRAHAAAGRAGQRPQEPALAKAGDRHAMLSPQLLKLLRAWWREGRRLV